MIRSSFTHLKTFTPALLFASLMSSPAFAQSSGGGSGLLNGLEKLLKAINQELQGPIAIAFIGLLIIGTGYTCALGRWPWVYLMRVCLTAVLIVGGLQAAEFLVNNIKG